MVRVRARTTLYRPAGTTRGTSKSSTAQDARAACYTADEKTFVDTSLWALTPESRLRKACISTVESFWFTAASTLLIVAFCVVQCFYDPLEPLHSGINGLVEKLSLAFTVAFSLEILLKCTAWAFVLDDGESLGSMWRRLRGGAAAGLRTVVLGASTEPDKLAEGLAGAAVQFKTAAKWKKAGNTLMVVNQHKVAQDSLAAPGRSKELGDPGASSQLASCQPPAVAVKVAQQQDQQLQQQPQQPQQQRDQHSRIRGDSARIPQNALEALHELDEEHEQHGPLGEAADAAVPPDSQQMAIPACLPVAQPQRQQLQRSGAAQRRPRSDSAECSELADLDLEEAAGGCHYASLPPGQPVSKGSTVEVVVHGVPAAAPAAGAAPPAAAAAPPAAGPASGEGRQKATRGPFLRDGWGQLDFCVVVASWITFIPGIGIQGAAAMRAMRLLLPLRSITMLPAMRSCVLAVLRSLPMLANIVVATLFILWMWAVLGLQLYMGPMHQNCFEMGPDGPLPFPPPGDDGSSGNYTAEDNKGIMCSVMGGVWPGHTCAADHVCQGGGEPPQYGQLSFDNLAAGAFFDFLILSTMWWGMVTSYLMEATVGWSFFYSLLLVLLGWFLLSLVLAAIGDKYIEAELEMEEEDKGGAKKEKQAAAGQQKEREEQQQQPGGGGGSGGTHEPDPNPLARAWDCIARPLVACWQAPLPGPLKDSEKWRLRRWSKAVVDHWAFEVATILAVLANTVLLAMPYYGMSAGYLASLEAGGTALILVFVAEATIKLLGLGRQYFSDPFNVFDFFVTAASLATLFLRGTGMLGALRVVRLLRLLRLLTVIPSLQRFLRVLGKVLPRTAPFFALLFIVVFIFALLGMMLFGGAWDRKTDPEAPRLNFNSIGAALATVYDCLTGTLDITIFYAMSVTSGAAALYYISLTVLGGFLVLNLLVAILYELFKNDLEGKAVEGKEGPLMRKLKEMAKKSATKVRRAYNLRHFKKQLSMAAQEKMRRQSLEAAEGGAAGGAKQAGADGDDDKKPLHLLLFPCLDPDRHHEPHSSQATRKPYFNTSRALAVAQALKWHRQKLHLPPLGSMAPAAPPPPPLEMPSVEDSAAEPAGAEVAVEVEVAVVVAPATSSEASPQRCQAADSKERSAAAKELAPAALPKQPGSQPQKPGAAGDPAPPWRRLGSWLLSVFTCDLKWKGAIGKPLYDFETTSFWVLHPQNRLRRALFGLVDDRRFEALVLLVIFFNCGVMAVENPGNADSLARLLDATQLGSLGFYTVEMVIKLLALGAWSEKGVAYFRSPWNILDFVVVVVSLVGAVLWAAGWSGVFRLLRVLRPLRLISRLKEIQASAAVVTCLLMGISGVLHVLVVVGLVQLMFAVLGLQLFMGKMHYCSAAKCCSAPRECQEVTGIDSCTGNSESNSELECTWNAAVLNFDNIWNSWTTLAVIMTGSGWSDALHAASDTVGIGLQPQQNFSGVVAVIYFVVWQSISQFFLLNLFISIILDKYLTLVERKGYGAMLTDRQKDWVEAQGYLLRDVLETRAPAPEHPHLRRLHAFVSHVLFGRSVLLCILLSGIVLSLEHYGQGPGWDEGIYSATSALTVAFCLESLLMVAAHSPSHYFSNSWNCFDFAVSWGSVPSIFIASGPGINVLRAVRVVRLLRVVKYFQGLRRIVATLFIALPTIGNAMLLVILFLFIFSVLGCQLFYGITPLEPVGMTMFLNWNNVGNAFMMLTVAATGDAWDAFLLDTACQPPNCDEAAGQCGNPLASLFFLPFMLLCSSLLLSILVAVVIEAYKMTRDPPKVTNENFQQYKGLWMERDPGATGFIHVEEMHSLLLRLDHPLGYKNDPEEEARAEAEADSDLVVDEDGSIYYHQALQTLTAKAADICLEALGDKINRELQEEINLRKERQRQRQRQQQLRLQRTSSGAVAGSGATSPLTRLRAWGWGLQRPSGSAASAISGTDRGDTTPVSGRASSLTTLARLSQRVTASVFSSPWAATPGTPLTAGTASPGSSDRRTTTGSVPGRGLQRSSAMRISSLPRSLSAPQEISVAAAPTTERRLMPHLEEAADDAVAVVSMPPSASGAQESGQPRLD